MFLVNDFALGRAIFSAAGLAVQTRALESISPFQLAESLYNSRRLAFLVQPTRIKATPFADPAALVATLQKKSPASSFVSEAIALGSAAKKIPDSPPPAQQMKGETGAAASASDSYKKWFEAVQEASCLMAYPEEANVDDVAWLLAELQKAKKDQGRDFYIFYSALRHIEEEHPNPKIKEAAKKALASAAREETSPAADILAVTLGQLWDALEDAYAYSEDPDVIHLIDALIKLENQREEGTNLRMQFLNFDRFSVRSYYIIHHDWFPNDIGDLWETQAEDIDAELRNKKPQWREALNLLSDFVNLGWVDAVEVLSVFAYSSWDPEMRAFAFARLPSGCFVSDEETPS